jgi:hypothetical protein
MFDWLRKATEVKVDSTRKGYDFIHEVVEEHGEDYMRSIEVHILGGCDDEAIISVVDVKRSWFGFGKPQAIVSKYRGSSNVWYDAITGSRIWGLKHSESQLSSWWRRALWAKDSRNVESQ